MAVLGIVAEFNPFHNGHRHLIEEAGKAEDFAAIVCVMSGNFVQRGEPALCNKWARARMALNCGADLVIEIPFCFAARSAYYFARAAVQLLSRTGVVTHIAFGSENGNIQTLKKMAAILAHEPQQYKTILKKNLSRGLSFPLARSKSLQEFTDNSDGELENILLGSNNILAIEYLRVIEEENLALVPLGIPRKGSKYHSTKLSTFSSATAIRNALNSSGKTEAIAAAMPAASLEILAEEIQHGRAPVLPDALEQAILFKLRSLHIKDLEKIYEISEGLEYRFKEAAVSCGNLDELRKSIKSKRYSLTRINRTLLYSLFSLSKNQAAHFDKHGPLYLHILGFSAKGRKILQEIKIKSKVKILNRGSDVRKACNQAGLSSSGDMIALDVYAGDIYSLLFPDPKARTGALDFTTSPVKP